MLSNKMLISTVERSECLQNDTLNQQLIAIIVQGTLTDTPHFPLFSNWSKFRSRHASQQIQVVEVRFMRAETPQHLRYSDQPELIPREDIYTLSLRIQTKGDIVEGDFQKHVAETYLRDRGAGDVYRKFGINCFDDDSDDDEYSLQLHTMDSKSHTYALSHTGNVIYQVFFLLYSQVIYVVPQLLATDSLFSLQLLPSHHPCLKGNFSTLH